MQAHPGSDIIESTTSRSIALAATLLGVAVLLALAWTQRGAPASLEPAAPALARMQPVTTLPLDHPYAAALQSKKRNARLKSGSSVDPAVFMDISRVGVVNSSGVSGFASPSTANQAAQMRQAFMFYRGPAQNLQMPADAHMAMSASTQERVIVTNSAYGVWGSEIFPSYEKRAYDFWVDAASGNVVTPDLPHPYDPVVYRDEKFDRWVIVALDGMGPTSNLLVAVSRSGSPRSGWHRRKISVAYDGRWLDRIHIAGNAGHLIVTGNYFTYPGGPNPAERQTLGAAFIFNKAALYASATLPSPTMVKLAASSVVAADDPDQAHGDFILMSNDLDQPVTRMGSLALSGSTWALQPLAVVGAGWQPIPGGFVQQTRGFDVQADSRLLDCVRRNGSVYCVFMAYTSLANQVPLAFWMQWSDSGLLLQYGDTAGSAARYNRADVPHWSYFPTLAVDANSNMAITFTADDIYPLGVSSPDRVEFGMPGLAADAYVGMLWRSPQTPRGTLELRGQQIMGGKFVAHGGYVVPGIGPNPLPRDITRAGDYAAMTSLGPGVFHAVHGVGTGGALTVPVGNAYQTVDWITQQQSFAIPSGSRPPDVALTVARRDDALGTVELVANNLASETAVGPMVSAVADSSVRISAMSAGGRTCVLVNDNYRECLLPDLPGRGSIPVSVTYTGTGALAVELAALTGDAKPEDNKVRLAVATAAAPPPATTPAVPAPPAAQASGGGCTVGRIDEPLDPSLLGLAGLALWSLARRRRKAADAQAAG